MVEHLARIVAPMFLVAASLLAALEAMECLAQNSSQPTNNGQVNSAANNESISNNTIEDSSADLEQFWLNERELFFNQTTFNLGKRTRELVGHQQEELGGGPNRTYHLPFWFSYPMFSNLTERSHSDPNVALKRHHIYADNCVYIWKHNALRRLHRPNNWTFIDLAEDWTQAENFNEEWNEIDLNLTSSERRESPQAKALRLVQEELRACAMRRDKALCLLLLVDLDERFGPSMKLRYPFEEERYRNLLDLEAAEEAAADFTDALLAPDGKPASYWLARRQQFFANTSFALPERTRGKLLASSSSPTNTSNIIAEFASKSGYHLPFWFDYEVFKRMVGRINESPQEELKSHHKYIESCLEIWNETASERLGQLDYEAGGITSHVDIPARTCLYNCNPFDYDLSEEEIRESPIEKALRLVQEELESSAQLDTRRTVLLLAELDEKFDFPRARGMKYPFEPERSHEDFWKYIEERDKAIADFVKSLA